MKTPKDILNLLMEIIGPDQEDFWHAQVSYYGGKRIDHVSACAAEHAMYGQSKRELFGGTRKNLPHGISGMLSVLYGIEDCASKSTPPAASLNKIRSHFQAPDRNLYTFFSSDRGFITNVFIHLLNIIFGKKRAFAHYSTTLRCFFRP